MTASGGGRAGPLRRLRWLLIGVAAFFALWLAVIAGNSIGRYLGWFVPGESPASLAEALRPYYRIATPEGDGPFPTALLYSGCDGPGDNLERWAAMLRGLGWASVIVDSHTPRGYLDLEMWRLVCAGQLMMGSERAADVLVSIADARAMPFVDPERLALIGASHGGWAIMELFAFEKDWELPFGLTGLPEGANEAPLAGVIGAVLLYPYCGTANRARRIGWRLPAPSLFLLAGEDMIAPAEDCLEIVDLLEREGAPVEAHVFPGVTHAFDQAKKSPLSLLAFDEAATREAMAMAATFLDGLAPPR